LAKIKINKLKFIRNISICIIAVILVAIILNITPGYKRDKYGDVVNLVLNEKNITEKLKNDIYLSEKGVIYLSKTDVKELFDENIYYDERYNQIITTSDTKVANIAINNKQITVNDSTVDMLEPVIKINDEIYIPISDMTLIYNIEVKYIKEKNIVIIDNLDKGMIKADIAEDTEIRYKPRTLSKIVGELKTGDAISCFYTTSKGWREIRTEDGIVGYVKANKITNEYILRQDMKEKNDAKEISIYTDNDGQKYVDNEKIEFVNLYSNKEVTDDLKIWLSVKTDILESVSENLLEDYKKRTCLIDEIVNNAILNKATVVNIECNGNESQEIKKRFIIELAPKLREIGISTSIVLKEENKDDYLKIVDYIVTDM